jgi:hypothetical protein
MNIIIFIFKFYKFLIFFNSLLNNLLNSFYILKFIYLKIIKKKKNIYKSKKKYLICLLLLEKMMCLFLNALLNKYPMMEIILNLI